ncbi:MAG TPA: hypothetical protein VEC93_00260 [Anaerolineae bacterium]|nr:hypothetical protein [Anaerolineae bacterium]
MNTRTEAFTTTNYDTLRPQSNKEINVQTLARNIQAAQENGGLFILAAQLRALLEEFYEKNGPGTAAELEALILWAARGMVGEEL